MAEPVELLQPVVDISRRAGEKILKIYATDFDVEHKDDESPLTAADLAAHHCIIDGLRELTPDIPILSEEDGLPDFETRRSWKRYWIVDPLDGTKEFVQRNGDFTVNIALIEDGIAVLGVVHAPVHDASWFAAVGSGAWKQEKNGPLDAISTARVGDTQRIVASRNHRGEAVDALMERLPNATDISVGSSLKLCMVAEGKADLYPRLGPTSEWDTAAGQCVVEQAGGLVTTTDFLPLKYNSKDDILNPHFLVIGDPTFDWQQYFPH
ncbi:MAG: 3'(2'),5'-bisphosphate nucleotidase CysQ [Salinisphaeraceae bacterium]|nr:3'(2'),5'-bisphosphate nucleotidase CysQ [Salinisphaeraceae bacterium]